MNTKQIGALMIALLLWGGFQVFVHCREVDAQRHLKGEATRTRRVSSLPRSKSALAKSRRCIPWLKALERTLE